MKKLLSLTLAIMLLLSLGACKFSGAKKQIKEDLEASLDAIILGENIEDVYAYTIPGEQLDSPVYNEVSQMIRSQAEYEILDIRQNGDNAEADVHITAPDSFQILTEIEEENPSDTSIDNISEQLEDKLSGDYPTVEDTITVTLIYIDGKWYIVDDNQEEIEESFDGRLPSRKEDIAILEENPTPDEAFVFRDTSNYEVPDEYMDILNKCIATIEHDTYYEDLHFSIFASMAEIETLGCAFIDIDKNGTDEMILGVISEDTDNNAPNYVGDVFAMADGEVRNPFSSVTTLVYQLCNDSTIIGHAMFGYQQGYSVNTLDATGINQELLYAFWVTDYSFLTDGSNESAESYMARNNIPSKYHLADADDNVIEYLAEEEGEQKKAFFESQENYAYIPYTPVIDIISYR